jgi:phosphatidylserine decarboxylase
MAVFFTFWLEWYGWAVFFTALALFICFFFRNPKRLSQAHHEEDAIMAPADGRIIAVEEVAEDPVLGRPAIKISTFMSVFNCHVNRLPVNARVGKIVYHPGRFLVASRDKASEHNERNAVLLKDDNGREMIVVQIAGFVARRIVCYLQEGLSAMKGSRLGLIRFGSRVDLYLPPGTFELKVQNNEKVKAGQTVMGRWL